MIPDENVIPKVSYFRRGLVEHHPLARIRRFLFGYPLKTSHQHKERLGFWLGFPVLAVDTVSSLAYATEEILLALSILGTHSFSLSIPIAGIIILLMWSLVVSYSQTVKAYPEGGGAYIVAKYNIGPFASIFGASALILDYILTVAVSVTAGVRALTSAYPQLLPVATELSLMGVLILGWLNLRGVKESARVISLPVYAFILMVIAICFLGFFTPSPENNVNVAHQDTDILWSFFTLFIVLRAFAGGCTAMTGIEAVANAGRILKEPTSRISQHILLAIGLTVSVSFFWITKLVNDFGIGPSHTESIMSQLAWYVLDNDFLYTIFQFLTAGILFLAANTAFAGFPQLAAMVAKDKWLPKQLNAIGDRLVFSYGIVWLTLISCLLIILFKGDTHALIPLYAIGVFSAFTLNQVGMTRFWFKAHRQDKRKNPFRFSFKGVFSSCHTKMFINAFGATLSGLALIVTFIAKFTEGGFLIFVAIPLMIRICYTIRNHYQRIEKQLAVTPHSKEEDGQPHLSESMSRTVVIPVSFLHRGTYKALSFAREISKNVVVLIVDTNSSAVENTCEQLEALNWGLKIVILPSPYRSILQPIIEYVHYLDGLNDQLATIILPEIVPAKWWQHFLHNRTADALTRVLSWSERIPNQARIIINVPFHVKN